VEGAAAEQVQDSMAYAVDTARRSRTELTLGFAQSFSARLVRAWWYAIPKSGLIRPSPHPLDRLALSATETFAAEEIGRRLSELDPERAAFEIGSIYTSLLPAEYRSSLGIYYTPPTITARLIEQATAAGVNWATARVLDPACGGGAFLSPVAKRMVAELADCSPRILIENVGNRLRGLDIDPFGAWLSQICLDAVLLPISSQARRKLPWLVHMQDSLEGSFSDHEFDLVIGNPPYGRINLDAKMRQKFSRVLYGHANLYSIFLDLALRYGADKSIIAYVTPTSFLSGEYFKNLRAILGKMAPPVSINFVAARKGIFDTVLQETLLATFKKGAPETTAIKLFELVPGHETHVRALGTARLPCPPCHPWILPRSARQSKLVKRLSKLPHRLADWGYAVSTGPLVWNRHKNQLTKSSGPGCYPLIWAEAITSSGDFVFRAQKRKHAPYFRLRRGDEWLLVSSPCVLVQRTTAKEQARRLIAAELPNDFIKEHGGAVVENHLNMIRPSVEKPAVSSKVLGAFLNSIAADDVFRCISGSVAVSAYELESMPLPALTEMRTLQEMLDAKAPKAQIEQACHTLYWNFE